MHVFLSFLVVTIIVEYGSGFLMNTSYETGNYGYQYLVGLIMDEKISRHQLESKLSNMEQAYAEITKQLQKDRNNRQQLIDDNTRLNIKLMNATVDLNKLGSRFEKLLVDNNRLEGEFENLTVTNQNLNDYTKNLTATQGLLEKKVFNLTKEQDQLSSKHNILLEQYLKVTSHNQELLNMNSNISAQLVQIRQKMNEHGVQVGFSMQNVNKTASSSQRLKFTTPRFNRENMFNISRGEFVCERAGLYFFIATIVREPGTKQSYCFIHVNDSHDLQGTVGYGSSTDGYASGTTAIVYHLNVSDRVYLAGCYGIDHMYWTSSFSGFLIASD